jgi:hypothetical protein
MKQKKRTRAARKVRRLVGRKSIPIALLQSSFRRFVVPSIHDHPEYQRGYSDAVVKLHALIKDDGHDQET